jgi:3-oxoadipate enol-lactonase
MQTSHISSSGVHWIEQGPEPNAPAVLLLHGLGGDARFWLAEQAALARSFRVLAMDFRGSGQSMKSFAPFSAQDLVDDVVEVLDEAGLERASVVGFSMGGVVAQALALAVPDRVTHLVLAATFARVNPQARLFLQALGSLYRCGATARQMYELIVPWLYSIPFLAGPRAAEVVDYIEDPNDHQSPQDWLQLLDALLGYDGSGHLGDIRASTLIIAGDEDRLASCCDAEELAAGIHGATLETIPGGHLMNVESPDLFMAHVIRFLSVRGGVRA